MFFSLQLDQNCQLVSKILPRNDQHSKTFTSIFVDVFMVNFMCATQPFRIAVICSFQPFESLVNKNIMHHKIGAINGKNSKAMGRPAQ